MRTRAASSEGVILFMREVVLMERYGQQRFCIPRKEAQNVVMCLGAEHLHPLVKLCRRQYFEQQFTGHHHFV